MVLETLYQGDFNEKVFSNSIVSRLSLLFHQL